MRTGTAAAAADLGRGGWLHAVEIGSRGRELMSSSLALESGMAGRPTPERSPDVSVLTPSLNYGRFLRDALSSVRLQAGLLTEHVVQDGSSSDDSVRVLREFGGSVCWRSDADEGQSDALNRAFARSRGRWIAWLNADEFYLPQGLTRLLEAAETARADLVYGDVVFVDVDGACIRLVPQHPFHPTLLRWYGNFIASCGVLIRREILNGTPWDTSLRIAMDWDLYLRLARLGARFVYLPFPVAAFRLHEDQVIAQPPERFADEFTRLSRRHGVRSREARMLGRGIHDACKLVTGAYPRQLRARGFRGADLRWFDHGDGRSNCSALVQACYPEQPRRSGSRSSPGQHGVV